MRSTLLAVCTAATSTVACAGPTDSAEVSLESASETREVSVPHLAGGFLNHERSFVRPYCGAVLVAPNVVVTSSDCVADGVWELSFGVGDVDSKTIPVERAVVHPDANEDRRHALAVLTLERDFEDAVPAALDVPDEVGCDVEFPTYQYAADDEVGVREVWSACSEDSRDGGAFLATRGFPGCHGDSGAGAFLTSGDSRDRVIGWVTEAGFAGPKHPVSDVCVTSVSLATVRENHEFLLRAIEDASPKALD